MSFLNKIKQSLGLNNKSLSLESLDREINSLSLAQVKYFINEEVVSLGDEYVQIIPQSTGFTSDNLSSASLDFYNQYQVFDVLKSDLILNSKDVGTSEHIQGYICLGRDIGFAEIVCKNNEDAVFYLDIVDNEEGVLDQRMESIWHYLLVNLIVVYPFLYDSLKDQINQKT